MTTAVLTRFHMVNHLNLIQAIMFSYRVPTTTALVHFFGVKLERNNVHSAIKFRCAVVMSEMFFVASKN